MLDRHNAWGSGNIVNVAVWQNVMLNTVRIFKRLNPYFCKDFLLNFRAIYDTITARNAYADAGEISVRIWRFLGKYERIVII